VPGVPYRLLPTPRAVEVWSTARLPFEPRGWVALGARRFLKPFGATGVPWNPADEFCVYAHIILMTGEAAADEHPARWRLTAEWMGATR
jgi:hypothetical protein